MNRTRTFETSELDMARVRRAARLWQIGDQRAREAALDMAETELWAIEVPFVLQVRS